MSSDLAIKITPPHGPVTGFILTWTQQSILDSTPKHETRRVKFSRVWMVTLDHGYVTIGDMDHSDRKLVLQGEIAMIAWEWWNVWIEQNSMQGAP